MSRSTIIGTWLKDCLGSPRRNGFENNNVESFLITGSLIGLLSRKIAYYLVEERLTIFDILKYVYIQKICLK